MFYLVGDTQWVIGKFAYGVFDDDIKDEDVDVWLLRDCGTQWEKLGTAVTTYDNQHATVEGVSDSGGRVYFTIPQNKVLGLGRHRLRLVVGGDLSAAEMFIEVVPKKMPIFVSDVDGTLTTSENAEFPALLTGNLPDAHVDAAAALRTLALKGYRPFYMTARPEFLVNRTREFLDTNGFPPGLVHTTLTLTGATGSAAAAYKTGELSMIANRGLVPSWAFGNTDSDADAYHNGNIQPLDHRIFFQFTDSIHGGKRIESYTELLGPFTNLPNVCP
jgi:phosphatidate phosphatase PAH1